MNLLPQFGRRTRTNDEWVSLARVCAIAIASGGYVGGVEGSRLNCFNDATMAPAKK